MKIKIKMGFLIIAISAFMIIPSLSIASYKINENENIESSTFNIFYIKGDISQLVKNDETIWLKANDVNIIQFGFSEGKKNYHLENELMQLKKPFFGILSETNINGIFFNSYTQITSIIINGPDSIDEADQAQYSCKGTFPDDSTIEIKDANWIVDSEYAHFSSDYLIAHNIPGIEPNDQYVNINATYKNFTCTKTIKINDVNYIIENMEPPETRWDVPEGDCGEACIWTILQYYGINATEEEINIAGGNPGRGLWWNELYTALNYFNIKYNNLRHGGLHKPEDYEEYLLNEIVGNLQKGHPLLIGVVYPPASYCNEHFILIVGYTANDELIYNSHNYRDSDEFSTFLNDATGRISLINRCHEAFCIEFPLT